MDNEIKKLTEDEIRELFKTIPKITDSNHPATHGGFENFLSFETIKIDSDCFFRQFIEKSEI